jgi:hypothetical protein
MPTPAEAGATKDTKVAQALACVVFLIFSQLPVTSFVTDMQYASYSAATSF